ncbi:YlbF family regulator [Levilactobacillus zymae]|uniref:UPF0342 protein LZ3411_0919 n=1 Tax=Levilactobacillus zymae TaxID=267363 RepID=A0A1Y6JVK4_9LACO|nr:YlbF family regulator [Levilactobacillus zymae]KRL16557.1 hypothetical protein FD38_GL001049 [Levilactobacillus zymae DSM 19395]QFR60967.1 hypothetical protein LZ395_05215 [Levilactobacillus zymae]GEO72651.1 UPF0342 protein [Levilactobacillus zymae]SMS13969.1 hypothetical protein LZ3411_0919 [Levilactobacillus zymae]
MAENLKDLGASVAQALQATPEYQALQTAFTTMKADADTYKLFQDFQNLQMSLQQKQMSGQQLSDDELKQAQELATQVGAKPAIKDLMAKEKDVNQILNDLNSTITKPIQNIYQG